MHDVAIVGSGVAGVGAALGFAGRGVRPLILDVGVLPEPHAPIAENLYAWRAAHDAFELMVGDDLSALANQLLPPARQLPAKLAAPRMAWVVRDAESLGPIESTGFLPIQSFASGGLANAWGAGLYRYGARDLDGIPLRPADLAPFYDALTREIGITGSDDDLAPYFGSTAGLAPPLRLSRNAARVLRSYERRRDELRTRGVHLGRPRLAVTASFAPDGGGAHADAAASGGLASSGAASAGAASAAGTSAGGARSGGGPYANLEFWEPDLPHVYTPRRTLDRLRATGAVEYRPGVRVERFVEADDRVQVLGREVASGAPLRFDARTLVLAAGPINSARLALVSRRDVTTALPLLDNPAVQVPLILPAALGDGLETDGFGLTQLNLVHHAPDGALYQASLLEITSPARAEFFSRFPLAARSSLVFVRHFLPAMMVMQLFYPLAREHAARLRVDAEGRVHIAAGTPFRNPDVLPAILRALRRLGVFGFARLGDATAFGMGLHYAGPLPMSDTPGPYRCDRHGALAGWRRVYVADGACLGRLAAKNSSFTVMANAMRIADALAARLGARA